MRCRRSLLALLTALVLLLGASGCTGGGIDPSEHEAALAELSVVREQRNEALRQAQSLEEELAQWQETYEVLLHEREALREELASLQAAQAANSGTAPSLSLDEPAADEASALQTAERSRQAPTAQTRRIYYTRTGSKYHYRNPCGNGTYYPCTLEEALAQGLSPCGKCVG